MRVFSALRCHCHYQPLKEILDGVRILLLVHWLVRRRVAVVHLTNVMVQKARRKVDWHWRDLGVRVEWS